MFNKLKYKINFIFKINLGEKMILNIIKTISHIRFTASLYLTLLCVVNAINDASNPYIIGDKPRD